jgi:molecular chaperone DnaJ
MEAAVQGAEKDIDISFNTQDPRTGQVKTERRSVVVNVPPGVTDGMNLRVGGQGGEGVRGGPNGDMFVRVYVDSDPYFERAQNGDIHVEVPVSVGQAILGGTVDVRTVYGDVELKIPKGAQPGTKLLMRAKGGVRIRGGRGAKGDQIVHLKLKVRLLRAYRKQVIYFQYNFIPTTHCNSFNSSSPRNPPSLPPPLLADPQEPNPEATGPAPGLPGRRGREGTHPVRWLQ